MSISYRLFDERYINYDLKLVERGREKLMQHFINKNNLGLISLRGVRNDLTSKFGICKNIIDKSVISTLDNGFIFPLYLYPDSSTDGMFAEKERVPNLNMEIVEKIAQQLGLQFVPEKFPSFGGVPKGRGGQYSFGGVRGGWKSLHQRNPIF